MSPLVKRLQQLLRSSHEPHASPGTFARQAAVMALITDHPSSPELIYTLRANHLREHPGEVAFPGGKWEFQDRDLLATALRETHEEVALPHSEIRVLGSVKPGFTRAGTRVTPFVGLVHHDVDLVPNPDELESIFRVPLNWFREENYLRIDEFALSTGTYRIPAYGYQEYEIWGFTAAVTQEILQKI